MDIKNMIEHQKHIFNMLKQNKQNDRLSHAYLFYGEQGVGKKEMAYALACLFYCPNDACLSCETCNTILSGNHLNVNYIGIAESKKLISKEQITDLQEEFSKTSLVDGYRIYIVDGIDTASASAQNSLLKFIEEPQNNTPTIGIFIATDLANVVSTIVSRCALVHFPSLDRKKLIEFLLDEGFSDMDASLASLLTNNIGEAKSLIETKEYQRSKTLFLEFLKLNKKKDAILFFIQNQSDFTFEFGQMFFKWLIAFYEDIFKIDDKESLIFTGLYDKILLYIKNDYKALKQNFELILHLYSKIEFNVSVKYIVHELISKLF